MGDAVRKLLLKCAVMVGLLVGSGAAVVALVPPDRDDYLAVITDKMAILERTESPKIVFVGGSNLAFGLDSLAVEDATGYSVVNMGMGFNMGLRYMLELTRPHVEAGDVIVLVPEYNLFYGHFDGDERLIDVLELYPEGLKYLSSYKQYYVLLRNMPRHVQFKVNRTLRTLGREPDPDCVYCPRAFNDHGDVVAHLDKPGRDVSKMEFLRAGRRPIDEEAIVELNRYQADMEARGVRVVMLFPCIPDVHYEQKRDRIDPLYERLERDLEIPVLAPPTDYVYPLEYFYDWVYHLNRAGRDLRTASIIEDLESVLGRRYSNGTPGPGREPAR